jgi:glycerol kinase
MSVRLRFIFLNNSLGEPMMQYLLAIDQGTTSSRAMIFSSAGEVMALSQQDFAQYYPNDGWVEHDSNEIWQTTLASVQHAVKKAGLMAADIAAIGITNQRETTVVWDKMTGEPLYNAIVWQDRRTADYCDELKVAGYEALVQQQTGLLLDPYFSATKVRWILENVENARARAEAGELAFGTIDTFLLWHLTGGKVHATDTSNASRTMLFDIHQNCWSEDLLALFSIPVSMLPAVKDSADDFGTTTDNILDLPVKIAAMIGDQQAALFGQGCYQQGQSKSTYGTGCFLMVNTGSNALSSQHRLLSTVAYSIKGQVSYALEGSIFMAGAAMQWLRDGLKAIASTGDSEDIANAQNSANGVYLVPGFTGMGAPHWDPNARGAILGLTRNSTSEDIVVAGLESVAYQTRDLLEAIRADGIEIKELKVDGGMVANKWFVQFLADMLATPINRPAMSETTAWGAALLAGLQVGVYKDLDELSALASSADLFSPALEQSRRDEKYRGWQKALSRVLN